MADICHMYKSCFPAIFCGRLISDLKQPEICAGFMLFYATQVSFKLYYIPNLKSLTSTLAEMGRGRGLSVENVGQISPNERTDLWLFFIWPRRNLVVKVCQNIQVGQIKRGQLTFLSASLYFSKRGAYWDRLCRDSLVVGWLSGACTVAKRCILGL